MGEQATWLAAAWRTADRILWREVGEFACFELADRCIETRGDFATRHLLALMRAVEAFQAAEIGHAELLGTERGHGIRITLDVESWTADERAAAWRELMLEAQCASAVWRGVIAHG